MVGAGFHTDAGPALNIVDAEIDDHLPKQNLIRLILGLMILASTASAKEAVILLHGLARTERSMAKMAAALEAEGFTVLNVDYPSR